jgi:integrase
MPLTGKATPTTPITSAKSIERSKAKIMTDPARPGLRLVRSGERRIWQFRYRSLGGLRQVKLGEFPGITWAEAAKVWQRLKVERDDPERGDPVATVKAKRAAAKVAAVKEREQKALTLGRLIDDYLSEVIDSKRKPKGAAEVSRLLNAPAIEKVRPVPIADFTRKRAAELIKAVLAGRNGERVPRVAYMTRQELRGAWEFAKANGVLDGIATENPFAGKQLGGTFTFKPRERYLTDDEAARLLRWMRTPGAYSRTVADALELVMRTGLRSGEVCGIHSSELQQRDGVLWLDIPIERMKAKQAHSVPLVGRARDIVLSRIPDGGGFLFAGRRGAIDQKVLGVEVYAHSGRSTNEAYAKKRICPVSGWAPHDLRRTARQMLAAIGCPFEIGEEILAHKLPKVPRTYLNMAHLTGERARWLTLLNDHIDRLQPAEPVALHRAA